MRYFYDTEFIENGSTIDLVSIGIVAEDGREYYAVSTDADHTKANKWVREHVLDKLPNPSSPLWRSREQIRTEVYEFLTASPAAGIMGVDWCLRPCGVGAAVGGHELAAVRYAQVHTGAPAVLGVCRRPALPVQLAGNHGCVSSSARHNLTAVSDLPPGVAAAER